MSTIGQTSGTRSGGKAARIRRVAASPTPYDRAPSGSSEGGCPNWLSSATRRIAESAGRVVRSVFMSDSSSSFGAESSSSDDEVNTYACSPDLYSLDRERKSVRSNEDTGGLKKDSGLTESGSETKRAIVMLLMQETFSEEECERFIHIIKSRIVDTSYSVDVQEKSPRETPSRAIGPDMHSTDVCCIAVMEARKWINERKLRSDSKSFSPSSVTSCNYSYGSSSYNIKKTGSPVEIARSYMCGRPPSPMKTISAYMTPQSIRMHSFCEGSPLSNRGKALSFSEDLVAAVSRDVAEDTESTVIELRKETDALGGAANFNFSRPSLVRESYSPTEYKQCMLEPPNSVCGSHERVMDSMINNNEVEICKFASESSVEIPVNEYVNL
ncbi:unnamed protein product [Rhodiola kirilowii]